jgi:hypothetical protein
MERELGDGIHDDPDWEREQRHLPVPLRRLQSGSRVHR